MHALTCSRSSTPLVNSYCNGIVRISVNDQLSIALCPVKQGMDLLQWRLNGAHFITGANRSALETKTGSVIPDITFEPLGLKVIYGFCEDIWRSHEYKQGKMIVVCAGVDPVDITNTALLVGCFMILNLELSAKDVIKAFEPISHRFIFYSDGLRVDDCWVAIHHVSARCGWLRTDSRHFLSLRREETKQDPVETIDMDEFVHYDSPINGCLHFLVPEKLIIFNCPDDLPGGLHWADEEGERRFSAGYYADIFGDFGVNVVVQGCADGVYDTAAFRERGIEVEELPLDDDAVPTFAEVDRFLAMVRYAPGAVAVHGGRGGLGAAGTLIAAHLISGHGFLAADAIAWVRLIHPAALPSAHQRFLRENEARVLRHRLLSHSFGGRRKACPAHEALQTSGATASDTGFAMRCLSAPGFLCDDPAAGA
jgi:hypothetical protein